MKSDKAVLGFLAGLATGAILGILYAPSAGKETRIKIVEGAKEARDTATKTVKDLSKQAMELKDMAMDKLSNAESAVRDTLSHADSTAKQAEREIKQKTNI
ncbi:MAG: YtxH domain-containing protein [Bacteroidetes bacterium]|nr:YtxH domain-containing protein [Bacteroidota bacterium]MBP7399020.1 YtxH domain-containing protein [Chitinophagales bacterium]MBK7107667.1 YtxH domain-containing protein [Bacteroidota bacterium]MBK8486901.1 YtxH domain-containing protein [Bacteroidota bacterium]MBK8681201.1 YtxH domain-containing protein [Bacteroidota bacterium]